LSRAVAGIRNQTLIINLPGSPKGVEQCFAVIEDILPHALALISEDPQH
jgi:molybdopterin adenylyltransferase